ncbi:acyltransferase 3 (plasmid) [Glaciecola sp. 4H-3-7+YE-5]|nr:acyltransferase 3 [Glaciecola sp. 4H-3-7+YE-5]|tara:strand:- start:21770 stop:22909 length:1140 start_codon:yes stop_codon:yes gene_type:complete
MVNRAIHWDVLRAILVLVVINEHVLRAVHGVATNMEVLVTSDTSLWEYFWLFSPLQLLHNGAAAVSIMFALSGYLVSKSAFNATNLSALSFFQRIVKRYFRLTFPVVGGLLFFGVVAYFQLINPDDRPLYVHAFGLHPFDVNSANFISLIKQGFIDTPFRLERSHIPVLWVVALELFASFALILVVAISKTRFLKENYHHHLALSLGVVLIALFHSEIVIGFCLGYLLAVSEHYKEFSLPDKSKLLLCLLTIFTFMFAMKGGISGPFNFFDVGVHQLDLQYIIYSYGGAGLIFLIHSTASLRNLFNSPFLAFIGQRSYSILLVHTTVIVSIGLAVYAALPFTESIRFMGFALCVYVVSVIIGSVMYRIFEIPTLSAKMR